MLECKKLLSQDSDVDWWELPHMEDTKVKLAVVNALNLLKFWRDYTDLANEASGNLGGRDIKQHGRALAHVISVIDDLEDVGPQEKTYEVSWSATCSGTEEVKAYTEDQATDQVLEDKYCLEPTDFEDHEITDIEEV